MDKKDLFEEFVILGTKIFFFEERNNLKNMTARIKDCFRLNKC